MSIVPPGLVEVSVSSEFWDQPVFPGSFFTWSELVNEEVREQITEAAIANIRTLVWYHLDPARRLCGFPIYVHPHGGFAPPPYHQLWGHVENSQHRDGSAADIYPGEIERMSSVDGAITETGPFKLGRYEGHLHVGVVGAGFTHHPRQAFW